MSKIIKFDTEARSKMIRGVDTLANTVKITLGLSLDRYYNILINEIWSLSEKIKLLEGRT